MCNNYVATFDFRRDSNIHEVIKGNLQEVNTSLLTDYAVSAWFVALPMLLCVLMILVYPFFCCCYGNLKRSRRDWLSFLILGGVAVFIMASSMFLNLHLDNPSCHFEETRVVSKNLLSTLVRPADDVLLTFNNTIKEVQDSMKQAELDRGGTLLQIKKDYIDALDALELAAKNVQCGNCEKCHVCKNQQPLITVLNEIKALPVDDIQENIDSVDDLLIDAKDSVKDGVEGIKDTLSNVITFIDGDWKAYSDQFVDWSNMAQENTWTLWTPYILIVFSLLIVGISVLLGWSCMGCIGWTFMWWFLIIMFLVSFVLMLVSFVGLDVCDVLSQPVTEYVTLDNRSMDMIQSCLDDENVIPSDLVDNYKFTDMNFNSTESTIDYNGLTDASKVLYDNIKDYVLVEKQDAQAKELKFIKATKITYQNVKDIQNITLDLVDFGKNMVLDFRCTLLNNQYNNMKGSICYLTSTLFFYTWLFFGVALVGIPLLVSSVNLVLSLKAYELIA